MTTWGILAIVVAAIGILLALVLLSLRLHPLQTRHDSLHTPRPRSADAEARRQILGGKRRNRD